VSDTIGDIEYPAEPDTTPGRERDITMSGIVRQLDSVERELRLVKASNQKIIENQTWVNNTVHQAMQALSAMPGVGAMMQRMMGARGE
jgi:hypothetical protein